MDDIDNTFRKLKQIPYTQLVKEFDIYQPGRNRVHIKDFLEDRNWTVDEYIDAWLEDESKW